MHSESHVPRYGRELAPAIIGSGCRGVKGLVPQPLCMKFKSAPKSKLFGKDYNRPIGLSRGDIGYRRLPVLLLNIFHHRDLALAGVVHDGALSIGGRGHPEGGRLKWRNVAHDPPNGIIET